MKGFFGNLFGKQPEPEKNEKRLEPPKRDVPKRAESELYKKGDVIGCKYEVLGSLGKGGFGLVYLVYTRDAGEVCALKTFRDELINNVASREAFKKEASLWINLKSHPCILEAWWVDEVSGRLFVAMECITPDEQKRVTLADHLKGIRLEKVQVLEWAIQFCLGMEHARAQGIECHRDIKPPNILISPKRVLKISDFGLSLATEAAWRVANHKPDISTNGNTNGHQSLHLIQNEGKQICGTPGYIAPEILRGAGASVRSDIYSFGLVLWQMTSGSPTPPFMPKWPGRMDAFLAEIYRLQTTSAAPPVENQIDEIIARCLKPAPEARYRNFGELCNALEPLLLKQTGRKIEIRELEHGKGTALNNRAYSFAALGRSAEAKKCYEEVIVYFDKVLAKNPKDAKAWCSIANALDALERYNDAIRCYKKALEIEPQNLNTWNNTGTSLNATGRYEEAIVCYERALAIDLRNGVVWCNKGNSLSDLERYEEAVICYDRALEIDLRDATAWYKKGNALDSLGKFELAINCFDKVIVIDPLNTKAWNDKGLMFAKLNRHQERIACYDKASEIGPSAAYVWFNKGNALAGLERREEAVSCYYKAVTLEPGNVRAWYNKAVAERMLGRVRDAIASYRKFIELAPPDDAKQIAVARQCVQELESKSTPL